MRTSRRITVFVALGLAAVSAVSACDPPSALETHSSSSHGASTTLAAGVPPPTNVPTACSPKGGGQLRIGVVDIDQATAFFTQMDTGIETVAKKAGAKVQLVSGNDDAATQVSGIENLVSAGVNAIIVDPYNPTALAPALTAAKKAGIAVVAADGSVTDTSAIDTQVGTANYQGGTELGKSFLKLTGGKGTVGVVSALNSTIQIQRQNGFQDTVKAGGMKVGTVVDGENAAETAQTAAENLLTGSPNLKYVYATGSPALDGAIAAVKSQNDQSRIQLVGWDLDPTSAAGLNAGYVKAVIQQDTYGFGYAAADAAINLACHSAQVPKTISVPIHIVTKANLANYQYYLKGQS
jgi:ribose transport system substrate-binding protein